MDLVKEMFSKVAGHSSIARLANQIPVSFAGNEIMTFSKGYVQALEAEESTAYRIVDDDGHA